MKRGICILLVAVLVAIAAGCGRQIPADGETTTQSTVPSTTEALTEATTEASTEEEPTTDIDPMGLVGFWQRTHAEVEGDRVSDTGGSITISGLASDSLTFAFADYVSSNFNTSMNALEIKAGELFAGCGNDIWYAEATSGDYVYAVTMLDDNTLLLQLTFDFDGMPMVSTQWFARSE